VKEAAAARHTALDASRKFHDFSADVDDLRGWMADKLKTASDESYRDLTNLERKLQKHEAFERELHANEGQLRAVNKVSTEGSVVLLPLLRTNCVSTGYAVADWAWASLRGQLPEGRCGADAAGPEYDMGGTRGTVA
jgi:spectrin beta